MIESIEPVITLPHKEEQQFAQFIKHMRRKMIAAPKDNALQATQLHSTEIEPLLNHGEISKAIILLRKWSYDAFLKEEAMFNSVVLSEIDKQFQTPKHILNAISNELLNLSEVSKHEFQSHVSRCFGAYAGAISPYIYQLCLSNTQSRRSRAGKVFEGIIYFLYEYFKFPYDSQSTIGKQAFADLRLGKMVDSILPSKQAFIDRRTKTIVGSMKTTLRERWQEVVEEIARSNLPNIHLLTIDDDISDNKAEQMAQHNIILVVLREVKLQSKLVQRQSIIDFEDYFTVEIPLIMRYWYK